MILRLRDGLFAPMFGNGTSHSARPASRRRKCSPILESLEGRQPPSSFAAPHALFRGQRHAEVAGPFLPFRRARAFAPLRPLLGTWQTQTFFSAYATSTMPNTPNVIGTTDVYVKSGNSLLKTVDATRPGFAGDNLKIVPTGGNTLQLQFYHPGNSTTPVAVIGGYRTGLSSWVFTGSAPLDPSNPSSLTNVRLTYSFITLRQRSFTNEILVNNQYQLLYTSLSTKVS